MQIPLTAWVNPKSSEAALEALSPGRSVTVKSPMGGSPGRSRPAAGPHSPVQVPGLAPVSERGHSGAGNTGARRAVDMDGRCGPCPPGLTSLPSRNTARRSRVAPFAERRPPRRPLSISPPAAALPPARPEAAPSSAGRIPAERQAVSFLVQRGAGQSRPEVGQCGGARQQHVDRHSFVAVVPAVFW
jgi:hypothetical protein